MLIKCSNKKSVSFNWQTVESRRTRFQELFLLQTRLLDANISL